MFYVCNKCLLNYYHVLGWGLLGTIVCLFVQTKQTEIPAIWGHVLETVRCSSALNKANAQAPAMDHKALPDLADLNSLPTPTLTLLQPHYHPRCS